MPDAPGRPGRPKCSDIDADHVVELARAWQGGGPGVVAALMAEGFPEKVALRKVEKMVAQRRLDCGVSPYYAWPT